MLKAFFWLVKMYRRMFHFVLGFCGFIILAMVLADLIGMSSNYFEIHLHKNFWNDVNTFAVGDQDLASLEEKYTTTFSSLAEQAFWMFYPSEKTITFRINMQLSIGKSVYDSILIMLFMYFLFCYVIRSLFWFYCEEHCLDSDLFFGFSWKKCFSLLFSTLVVALISCINAYFEQSNYAVPLLDLIILYFALSYTSAIWFLVIKFIIDAWYLKKGIDPHTIFKDDIIAMIITLILLVFYGNSPLCILSEIVAGGAPFIIFKIMLRSYPQHSVKNKKEHYAAQASEYILSFCWLIFIIVLIMRFSAGAMLVDHIESYEHLRYEKWSEELWTAYIDEKTFNEKNIQRLAFSQDKRHKNVVATMYALQKKKKEAYFYAKQAFPETSKRVSFILMKIKPKTIEKMLIQEKP
ncbi:hypothetical protein [Candidatus Uabimicrobium sp. HlEnr_7]|uniref:hypothetical protein n=1 Tax=Candidatus Uabimicrobium helgolandensis TaxID=3095367 RepID=UPI00355752BD